MKPPFRIGLGFDIHRMAEGRPCILGGVTIPHSHGPDGHSDADVLCHAIADAILGAAGLADIGHYFPNTDPACAGMDSLKIVSRAVKLAAEEGYEIGNIDASLIAEAPKIGPHLTAMKARLGEALGITPGQIGLKATTNEKLDDIGNHLGIAAHAVCLLIAGNPSDQ